MVYCDDHYNTCNYNRRNESGAAALIMDEAFKVTSLGDGIWAIDEEMVRCFLIVGEQKVVLLDCCFTPGTALSEVVHKLTDKPIQLIFTHADRDHIGGQDGFGTPWLHPAEYDRYRNKNNVDKKITALWESTVLELGGRSLEVLLIPGHTPGSIALLDRNGRRLFIGDSVSDSWIHMFEPGRNLEALIESLKKLESISSCFDTIHACHGTASLGIEWLTNTRIAAEKLHAGELEGSQAPYEMPCKVFRHEGVTFLY